jgi:hypothetical protein
MIKGKIQHERTLIVAKLKQDYRVAKKRGRERERADN